MPALRNSRHERFAQELAKGVSASEAYVLAGFKPNRSNAASLRHKEHISTRIDELLQQREEIHAQSTAKAIEATALTKEWVIKKLIENADRAMQAVPVTIKGVPTGEYQYDGSTANRALELLGKELGMFVERTENFNTNYAVSDQPTSEEQWADEHATTH